MYVLAAQFFVFGVASVWCSSSRSLQTIEFHCLDTNFAAQTTHRQGRKTMQTLITLAQHTFELYPEYRITNEGLKR
ncbi:hypothetical protein C5167_017831 [Papaver somniferum]|uniref:Secreted protein n=1 Tax=Papaver somniferum TaxID=3469 RepID=A0A4Y7IPI6_PAPSO|nr:hypothetical protein C5167_017831 [Papaver somniferum]